jgi:DNA-binding MarR family transcriptional regulator
MQLHEICYSLIMAQSSEKPAFHAWALLVRLQQEIMDEIEQALKAAGLPQLSWYDVLLELSRRPSDGLRPIDLERKLLLKQYNLSRLLDRMENAEFIFRRSCEDDRRGQIVFITDTGRDVQQKIWPIYAEIIQTRIGERLTGSEISTLIGILGKMPRQRPE